MSIATNYVEQIYNDTIFHKDGMSSLYTKELIDNLNSKWTSEKIKIILDLISFLTNDKMANNNVKSLENILETIDIDTYELINSI